MFRAQHLSLLRCTFSDRPSARAGLCHAPQLISVQGKAYAAVRCRRRISAEVVRALDLLVGYDSAIDEGVTCTLTADRSALRARRAM
jgi:hypothetical protein